MNATVLSYPPIEGTTRVDPNAPNPYAPPKAEPYADGYVATGAGEGTPRHVALYTSGQVVFATFLGTPLAGAILMALNENRLGKPRVAAGTVFVGVVASALLVTASFLLPDSVPGARFLGLGALFVIGAIARARQGESVRRHLASGGAKGSSWAAAGIGLAALVVILVPLILIVLAAEQMTTPTTPDPT